MFIFTSWFLPLLKLWENLIEESNGVRVRVYVYVWQNIVFVDRREGHCAMVRDHLLRYFLKHFNYSFMCGKHDLLYSGSYRAFTASVHNGWTMLSKVSLTLVLAFKTACALKVLLDRMLHFWDLLLVLIASMRAKTQAWPCISIIWSSKLFS